MEKKMNVKALYDYVLFKESENPFLRKVTKSGIFISDGFADSNETGNLEKLDQVIGFGVVEVAGTQCQFVKPGDGIFYDRRSIRPVPMSETLWQFSERNIVAYVEGDDEFYTEAIANSLEEAKQIQESYRQKAIEEDNALRAKNKLREDRINSGEIKETPLSPIIKIK